jgi:hypothetical protein
MKIIINDEPFTLNSNYLVISHRLKGLDNCVVSGGDLVDIEDFKK